MIITTAPQTRHTAQVVQLARKLETATTGKFPQQPRAVFLAQAQFIRDNPELAHSIAASLEILTSEAR